MRHVLGVQRGRTGRVADGLVGRAAGDAEYAAGRLVYDGPVPRVLRRLRRLLSRRLEDNMERWLRTAMRRWRERALDNRYAKQPPPMPRFFSSDSLRLKCLWLLLCPFGVLASARVALAALWRSAPHSYRHPLLRSAATDPMSVH